MAKKPNTATSAKAAKQKKTLIALSVLLALAGVYAFHTMQGLRGHTPEPVAASVVTTPGTATTPAPSVTPAAAPQTATTPSSFVLVSAVKPAAGTGQLQSFSHFESKDPFAAGGPKDVTAPASTGSSSSSTPSSAAGAATPATSTTATTAIQLPPAPPPTSAVIAVNGVAASVTVNADFPVSTDPTQNGLFDLVSLTENTATVSVVGGSYATGAATLTLKVNKPVTLVNTADGKRYTLELFPQGTPAPAPPASSGATGATSTTPATSP
ncbi:MAG TPA: hypothetical protein VHD91_10050 [Gaiellaceae bacterium]|nr:hypothetical protein [Gaiellaceae bacterium]